MTQRATQGMILLGALLVVSLGASGTLGGEPQASERPAPGPQELAEAWQDLASTDARKAYQAIWRLVEGSDQTVAYLRPRLHPIEMSETRLQKLIADLDDDSFAVREAASRTLASLGQAVEPVLRKSFQEARSAEVVKRIGDLLKHLPAETLVIESSDLRRMVRAIQVLEYIGSAQAQEVLQRLAKGAAGVRATDDARAALQRLGGKSAGPS